MDVAELIDHLEQDGPRLIAAADRAGWEAPVPGTEWYVRELVAHTGGVHRWATAIVSCRPESETNALHAAVGDCPSDAELSGWFTEGHRRLVAALREAPEDLEAMTFLPARSPRHFWARRQAHETAIHRADAETAAGEKAGFERDFAADGIAEILEGFAARRSSAIPKQATMALLPDDGAPSWLISFGGERTVAMTDANSGASEAADVVLRGSAGDLYLWLWNRKAAVHVHGATDVAALWASKVRVRWN